MQQAEKLYLQGHRSWNKLIKPERQRIHPAIKLITLPVVTAGVAVAFESIRARKNRQNIFQQIQVDFEQIQQQSKNVLTTLQKSVHYLQSPLRRLTHSSLVPTPAVHPMPQVGEPVQYNHTSRQPTQVISLPDMPPASKIDVTISQEEKKEGTLTSTSATASPTITTAKDKLPTVPFAVTPAPTEQRDTTENHPTSRRQPYWFDE